MVRNNEIHGRQQRGGACKLCVHRGCGHLPDHAVKARWQTLLTSGRQRTEEHLRQHRQGAGDAGRIRRSRRSARLPERRRSDHHLHRFSGSSSDDPEMYKIAGELLPACSRHRPRSGFPHAEHLRRPLRHHGLPPDRLCHARRGQRSGGHGPRSRCSPCSHQGAAFPSTSLTASAPLTRSRGRRLGLRRPQGHVRHGTSGSSAMRALNPSHPPMRGSHGERRYLLPEP